MWSNFHLVPLQIQTLAAFTFSLEIMRKEKDFMKIAWDDVGIIIPPGCSWEVFSPPNEGWGGGSISGTVDSVSGVHLIWCPGTMQCSPVCMHAIHLLTNRVFGSFRCINWFLTLFMPFHPLLPIESLDHSGLWKGS